jgi:hypothetical protein
MTSSLRIVFSGMLAGVPGQGGASWAILQYVLGLRQLGHDVLFVEPVTEAAVDDRGGGQASVSAAYFAAITTRFGLETRAALLHEASHRTVGVPYETLRRFARDADLLINVSGMLTDHDLIGSIPRRAYLDLDPAFVQLWHAVDGIDMRFDAHTHFVTVGLAVGSQTCDVPTCGLTWIPTCQPVVLDEWPVVSGAADPHWTTVGHWRGYGSVQHRGIQYGQKAHSFRQLIDLPNRTPAPITVAMSIHADEAPDLAALARHGWRLADPATRANTPDAYRAFIQGSRGEIGVAKSGYVLSRCGWFSDRSVCYLASGRPVVAQDTGFSRYLPTGLGLLPFTTTAEAADALASVEADYASHSRGARALAHDCFRHDQVLGRLLDSLTGTQDAVPQTERVRAAASEPGHAAR